jgi:hypothetical protein
MRTAPTARARCWSRWSPATGHRKAAYFQGDAAFANPKTYEFFEAEGAGYTIGLPANRVLQDRIGYLLKRPVGNLSRAAGRVVAFYNQRGTCEQHVNEGKRDQMNAAVVPHLCRQCSASSAPHIGLQARQFHAGRWQCPRRRTCGR